MLSKHRIPLLLGTFLMIAALFSNALPGRAASSQITVLSFKPTADAFVIKSYPYTNFGQSTSLRVDNAPYTYSYLRFVVSGLNGAPVQSAKIRIYAKSTNTTGYLVKTEANNTWAENSITYNNAPAPGVLIATSAGITAGQWVEVDISKYIKAEGTYNLVLTTSSNTNLNLASRESGANAPQLVVSLGTIAPTVIATKVSTATPPAPTATRAPTQPVSTQPAPIQPTATQPAPTQAITQVPTATVPATTGAVYYVSTSGSDTNSGTASSPWRTISKGISVLQAGDTLYLRSGTYVQSASLSIVQSGSSSSKRITIATAPGEPTLAIISGDTNGDGVGDVPARGSYNGLLQLRGSYLIVSNIEVAYSGDRGISSGGSNNVVSSSRVHHIWGSGIYVSAADNLIQGNTIWRAADSNYCNGAAGRQCSGNWGGGIAWGDAHDSSAPGMAPRIVIRNNTLYHISGEAILGMHSDYGLIEGNVVYDNWAENIYLDQCNYTTIQKNLVYYTNDTIWWRRTDGPASGILLANEGIADSAGNTYPVAHDQKILNNILVGNGNNIDFWKGFQTGSALINTLIANNTLVEAAGTSGTALKIDAGPHSNTRIYNNLILQTSGTIAAVGSTSGLSFAHNLWSKTPPTAVGSSTDVIANPLLVDPAHARTPGAVLADWYKITGTSPAISKAQVLSEITIDFWNTPRDAAPDNGANEYR